MGGFTATPLRRRLVLGGRVPMSPIANNNNNLRDPLFPDDSPLTVTKSGIYGGAAAASSSAAAVDAAAYSPGGGGGAGISNLFLAAAGVPVNFPTADIFTPVVKELAGGRNRVKYFKLRASLGMGSPRGHVPTSSSASGSYHTAATESQQQQPTARSLFGGGGDAGGAVPESSAYHHDTKLARGEEVHSIPRALKHYEYSAFIIFTRMCFLKPCLNSPVFFLFLHRSSRTVTPLALFLVEPYTEWSINARTSGVEWTPIGPMDQ